MKIANVVVSAALDKALSYECNNDCFVGQVVIVNLRNRRTVGVVISVAEEDPRPNTFTILSIASYFPFSIPAESIELIKWISGYTLIPLGVVLRMVVPFPEDILQKTEKAYQTLLVAPNPSSAAVPPANAPKTRDTAFLQTREHQQIRLNQEQTTAAQRLSEHLDFVVSVLDGVTGAGKTETYISAIIDILNRSMHCQVLILLPEIALTSMLVKRFEKYFDVVPDIWHSQASKTQKSKIWLKAALGQPMVVIGTRSALFIPFAKLALIVVDEEHDTSYKQSEQGPYHARDMAIVRARILNIPIILTSATPSIETMQNVNTKKYEYIKINSRFANASLPQISLIDMREEGGRPVFSQTLLHAITTALKEKEQVLLFINQRGYAPISICRNCWYKWRCPMCEVNLNYHKQKKALCCHYCGFEQEWQNTCPQCNHQSILLFGIGTERVLETIKKDFPTARTLCLSSDTIFSPKQWSATMESICNHEFDVILGTQILAKGHHFPKLTTVGVIDADQSANSYDLRTNERTYQLMHQVAGRAGRESRKGYVFLQTYSPESPLMQSLIANDRDMFYECELKERQMYNMPPFSRLVAIILSGSIEANVQSEAQRLASVFPRTDNVLLLGPAPAPFQKLRGLYRYRLLIKAHKNVNIQAIVRNWAKSSDRKVFVHIDVDPYDFV
ncbi:MAG: primosomal protein N' [Holosporales bacterium]|jgi:primosomal protein N' (replication factor Y)|nr:primosomal protein N' [Holosporales bacterium]